MNLIEEHDANREDDLSNMKHIFTLIGQQTSRGGPTGDASTDASNIAQIQLLLTAPEVRNVESTQLATEWSKRVGVLPGVEQLSFQSDLIGRGGDISIQLSHTDYNILLTAVERLKEAMQEYGGTTQVSDSHSEGKREMKIRLRPDASSLGIRESDLARQVRAAYYGAEAMRIQRGQNEVKVMVRYPEKDRRDLSSIDQLRIRTLDGQEIPFGQAAYVDEGRGYSQIQRADRRRVVNVTANIDRHNANAGEILDDMRATILPQLLNDYPGLSFDLEGQSRDRRESTTKIMRAFLFGILLIYGLLAVPFQSFVQPLVVMSAIPFGIVGAIGGHLLLGFNISMISMFGIVALTGVVVNASLVMIDFINRHRRDGFSAEQAVMEAGKRRFRPIVMTAMTTFFGLVPMILETSIQARFLVPMAVSLGFGVLFSTFITLVLVPTLYMIFEDIVTVLTRLKSGITGSETERSEVFEG
jgi:multidrug efflux pump subunit AcrB